MLRIAGHANSVPVGEEVMAANMYRVGDYVYFETSSSAPFQIRRIEELIKTPTGNVEAKVMCFYRRRDISSNLISLADKHQSIVEEQESKTKVVEPPIKTLANLSDKEKHQLKHRELFLSRQVETLPATHIRGKCQVTLLNETETLVSYLNKEDAFFYSLVYDPTQKTLLADKGEIRVGSKYQCDIPLWVAPSDRPPSPEVTRETLIYTPQHSLDDKAIDQFLVICRSVGTFARALDCSSSVKQPSLHMSAAAASRDITLFHAMETLHKHDYDMSKALCSLVPTSGPVLCRDEMEEWSASEANLFEEALEKYGKDFNDIRADFLPWKSLKSIVEYYYMWKTTDRYVQQKRVKAVEAEFKLKQVYIPNYNKNEASLSTSAAGRPCESCYANTSGSWYSWGPAHMQCRLCSSCWPYWKKFGGLKYPTRMEAVGSVDLTVSNGSGSGSTNTLLAAAAVAPVRPPSSAMGNLPTPAPGVPPLNAAANLALVQQLATMKDGPSRCPMCGKEFKQKAHLVRHCITSHGLNMALPSMSAGGPSPGVPLSLMARAGSPRPIVKTRAAFYLHTTPQTKQLRRQCKDMIKPRHAARHPFSPVDLAAIRIEMQTKPLTGVVPLKQKCRGRVNDISHRLGTPKMEKPEFLKPTAPERLPKPLPEAFPKKASMKRAATAQDEAAQAAKRQILSVHDLVGASPLPVNLGVPAAAVGMPPSVPGSLRASRKTIGNWSEAPDDLYFKASSSTRRLRKGKLTIPQLRRFARRATKYHFNMNKP